MIPVRDYLSLIAAHLHGLGRRVALLTVTLLVGIGLQLVTPQLIQGVIDGALSGRDQAELLPLAGGVVVLALVAMATTVAATALSEEVGWRATNRLRDELTGHVLSQDMTFHTTRSPGHLIERVDGDVSALSTFFSALVVKVLGNGVLLVGVVVLIALESWAIGLIVLAALVIGLLAYARLHGVVVPWWAALSATQAELYGQVGEQVSGAEDIVPNGASGFMQARFAVQAREVLPRTVRGWSGFSLMWMTNELLFGALTVAVFVIGAAAVVAGSMTVGSVFVVVVYIRMIERPLSQVREQMQELQKAGGAIARIEELQAVRPAMAPAGGRAVDHGALALTVERVTFTYPDEEDGRPVLRDVTVEVAAGRTLGVVGRTGSGKSTFAKLAVRLHEPEEGAVRLGGVAIGDIDDLRSHVGMVTQDVQLFRASLRDNLTMFDAEVSDERVRQALQDLSLGGWLATLPEGLDTVLDAGEVSAGQAQLIAFARIFLRDPGLVVLDEASSRLDPVTEALVDRAVERLLADRTAVIIAHRLHTLDRVDDILVLGDGQVLEHGDRRALAADPTSRFAGLLRSGMEDALA